MRALLLVVAIALSACSGRDVGATDSSDGGVWADAGADGGTPPDGGEPACAVGMDQTCNDSDLVSAVWGTCQRDGTCTCDQGFEINPLSGRCRPQGSFACGDSTCEGTDFCVERVHARDGGGFSSWMCGSFWQCSSADCTCAIQSFVSQSCINPTCVTETPLVVIQCDDLN